MYIYIFLMSYAPNKTNLELKMDQNQICWVWVLSIQSKYEFDIY